MQWLGLDKAKRAAVPARFELARCMYPANGGRIRSRSMSTRNGLATATKSSSKPLGESSEFRECNCERGTDCICYVRPPPVRLPVLPEQCFPRQSPHDQGKITLVLDLDETLVHSSFVPIRRYDFVIKVEIDKRLQNVYVIKRPGVEQFLKAMAEKFEVVVFTASLRKYADALLDRIDQHGCIRYRLYRESCRLYGDGLVKDLTILGRDLRRVIIIDNSPHSYALQPQNAVPISSFFDNPRDRDLLDLIPFLNILSGIENVKDALSK